MIRSAKSDTAVSPVIGTILLVAITVVLVAIIATVVMGMSGNVGNTKDVGLTVTVNKYPVGGGTEANRIIFTVLIYGGADASNLRELTMSLEGTDAMIYTNMVDGTIQFTNRTTDANPVNPYVSQIIGTPLYYMPYKYDSRVESHSNALYTVIGTFDDGTTATLYQSRISSYDSDDLLTPRSYNYMINTAKVVFSPIFL